MRGHIRELDGLRAIAVLAVMANHWGPPAVDKVLGAGHFGVRLFFVLSGFLITDILLSGRDRIAAGQPLSAELRTFYIRRTLRIFPVYYALLAGLCLAGVATVTSTLPWHLLYGSNIFAAIKNEWVNPIPHLWSLAVEEQFYLVWPLLVLTLPRKWLVPVFIGAVLAGVIFRAGMAAAGAPLIASSVLTPACLDPLAMGALLAAYWRTKVPSATAISAMAASGGVLLLAVLIVRVGAPEAAFAVVGQTLAEAICGVAIISAVLRWQGQRALAALRWAPVVYLGSISYGLYLFHPIVAHFLEATFGHWSGPARIGSRFVVTVAAASLSWQFFERPINNLKGRFTYRRAPRDTVSIAVEAKAA